MTSTQQRDSLANVVGLNEAAELAGVTHQTIRNWALNNIIKSGNNKSVLAAMNARKSGRKHTRYYYRDEVEKMAVVEVTPDLISVDAAAEQLGVTKRTIGRIRERQDLPAYAGPGHIVYLRREDIDKQVDGVTYNRIHDKKGTSDGT